MTFCGCAHPLPGIECVLCEYLLALDICKRRILSLNGLPGMPEHYTNAERLVYLGSIVPFECVNMVSSFLPHF